MTNHLRATLAPASPAHAWSSRETRLALVAVLAVWVTAAMVWPLAGMVVPWDSKNHFYPMLRYLGAALEHGELPLWNPYHFSGHPAVADPQSLLFTPTMLMFGWLVPSPSMQVFDAVVLAHLLPGALAMIPLFRRRGWHPAGAVISAIVFMLGGSAMGRLQHTGMIFSYGLFPLAFWLLEEALDRRSYRFGALFAFVAAMMTVGRDQVAFLCALTLIALVAHRAFQADKALAYARDRLPLLLAIGLIGAALLAVPTLLTMQLLATSTRPSFGYGVAAMGSLPPESLATVLFGNVFGSLRWTYDYWGPDYTSMGGATWTDRATNYLFAGTVPALLLLWHGIAGGRLFAREFRFFLAVGVLATVYALGRYTPVFEIVFDYLPGVKLYRRPADATFLINAFLALAAGYLVHRYVMEGLPTASRRLVRLVGPVVAVLLLAGAVAGALAFAHRAGQVAFSLREMGLGLVLAAGLITLAYYAARSARWRTAAAAALVAFTAGELVWRHGASALNAEPAERYAVFRELPPEQLQGLQILKTELQARNAQGERPRIEILGLTGAWQNASMVLGLEDTLGYNPLRLADYDRAVGPGENAVDPNLRQFPTTFRGYKCRLANLLGLEYLVLDRPLEKLPPHFPKITETRLLFGSGQMWIYHLTGSSPRTYVASGIVPISSEEVLNQEELPEFDRVHEALIDEGSIPLLKQRHRLGPGPATGTAGTARIVSYQRNAVEIEVDSPAGGVLVLHDIYYPGWEVTVNGERQAILRANVLFRGVEVPAGRHKVAFEFRPLSLDNLVAAATDLVAGEAAPEAETALE